MPEIFKIIFVIFCAGYLSCLIHLIIHLWQTLPIQEEKNDIHFYITKDLSEDLFT